MSFHARTITSRQAAEAAARALGTPSEVDLFETLSSSSPSVRAFIQTPEWAAIRERIIGDGSPPLGRPESLTELSRLMRWTADSVFSETVLSDEERAAYLHAAAEIDAFAQQADARAVPATVSELADRRPAA